MKKIKLILLSCCLLFSFYSCKEELKQVYYLDYDLKLVQNDDAVISKANVKLYYKTNQNAKVLLSLDTTDLSGRIHYKKLYIGDYEVTVNVPRLLPDTFQLSVTKSSTSIIIVSKAKQDPWQIKGNLYPGFPETFENGTKASYYPASSLLSTGNWRLDQAMIGSSLSDYPQSGQKTIRMQRNLTTPCFLQMEFDLPNGASKVTVYHGLYVTDSTASASWILEYSTDAGASWKQAGEQVITTSITKSLSTFDVNIDGPVRFRINKTSRGTIDNGFLSFDDFSVYIN